MIEVMNCDGVFYQEVIMLYHSIAWQFPSTFSNYWFKTLDVADLMAKAG